MFSELCWALKSTQKSCLLFEHVNYMHLHPPPAPPLPVFCLRADFLHDIPITPSPSVFSFLLQSHITIFANICNIYILLHPPLGLPFISASVTSTSEAKIHHCCSHRKNTACDRITSRFITAFPIVFLMHKGQLTVTSNRTYLANPIKSSWFVFI